MSAHVVATDCIDESTLVGFFAGKLPMEELSAVERHLDGCPDCAQLVEVAAPLLAGRSGPSHPFRLPPEAEPGGLVAGRYRIEGLIGQGASGYVLRARDELAGMNVAVKLLRAEPATQPALMQLFTRELRVARALNHPHVCRVFDLQASGETHFLVMELGEGSLRDELRSGAAGATGEGGLVGRLRDAEAIAAGLSAIHDAGIVHRDVKPENVLRLGDGRLVLSDFGLATLAPLGSATRYVGTPLYMAPEVAAGEPAKRASDLYSLGIVMHELFFGKRPEWRTSSRGRVLKDPPGGRGMRARAIARLTKECLADAPEQRPKDARVVLRRLGAIHKRHPWSLMAPSSTERRSSALVFSALLVAVGGGMMLIVESQPPRRASPSAEQRQPPPLSLADRARTPARPVMERWLDGAWRASFANDGLAVVNRSPGPGFDLLDLRRGKRDRQLLHDGGKDATISPDGRQVAFVTEPFPGALRDEEVWLLDRDSGDKKRLARAGYPQWSQDGSTLYFHDLAQRAVMALDMRASGAEPRVFFAKARSLYPAVAPDGLRIAFGERDQLVVVDRRDGSELMKWPAPGRRGLLCSWSPDGKLLAFAGFGDDPLGIWVLDPQIRRAIRLASEPSGRPAFTPDGKSLTFDSKVAVPAAIWRVATEEIRQALPTGLTREEFASFVASLKLVE